MRSLRKKRLIRSSILALLMAIMALLASGCGDQVPPDAVGIEYSDGPWEGRSFSDVKSPGATDWNWNDDLYYLPLSQRSYIIRNEDGVDVKGVISVPSQDNTLVNFEVSMAFVLNTRTDDIKDFPGGTLRRFFEGICRPYNCSFDSEMNASDGWKRMLREKLYPALESALKDEARKYPGDVIVGNTEGRLTELQTAVGRQFVAYLSRQTGGQYFCGPSFDRTYAGTDPALICPPVELLIISADYNNPGVRESREARKIADDQSGAQETLQEALKDPNYLEYLRIRASELCATSAKAICVFTSGASGPSVSVTPNR